MRRLLLHFLCVAATCVSAGATPVVVQDHNFGIEIPDNWRQVPPPATMVAVAAQSPDKQKTLLIGAAKVPDNEKLTSSRDMFEGVKKGMTGAGWTIEEEHDATIGGLPFHTASAHGAGTKTAIANVTSAGDQMYSVQLYSNTTEASKDPEILSILNSFHLLAAQAPNESAAYRAGYLVGKYGVIIAIAAFVLWLVFRAVRKKTAF